MYGYQGQMISWAEMEKKATWQRLHPEMRRRAKALIQHLAAKGTPLGVGTGWRVQPTGKAGFASPGNSWHEGVPVESRANALAIDFVPTSSFNAMEMEMHKFGLRSFRHVNNEPWHGQPAEIPASRRRATTLPTIHIHQIAGVDEVSYEKEYTPSAPLKEGDRNTRVTHLQDKGGSRIVLGSDGRPDC
jgi:hypothetical protein